MIKIIIYEIVEVKRLKKKTDDIKYDMVIWIKHIECWCDFFLQL
jgi:hypothetical protein